MFVFSNNYFVYLYKVMVLVLSVFVYLYNHIIDPVMIMLWCSPSPVSITSAQRI